MPTFSGGQQKKTRRSIYFSRASQVVPVVKKLHANAGDIRDTCSIRGPGRSPRKSTWQPTPVFLPEELHEQRNPAGYTVHRVAKTWSD